MKYLVCFVAIMSFLSNLSKAQEQIAAPSTPDNAITRIDGVGLPPTAASEGTSEQINLHNGALTMFVPALTLPQKTGMKPLVLGFTYDSNQYSLRETTALTMAKLSPDNIWYWDSETYVDTLSTAWSATPFNFNLPRLQASNEFDGIIDSFQNYYDSGGMEYDMDYSYEAANYCLKNFVFTDWSGVAHAFTNAAMDCGIRIYGNSSSALGVNPISKDVADDYVLDGSDLTNFKVIGPDGEIYNFKSPSIPCTYPSGYNCFAGGTEENALNALVTSVVDRNGNTISVKQSSNVNYIITDALGRTVTLTDNYRTKSLSYKDSNGATQSVELSGETAPAPDTDTDVGPYLTQNSCSAINSTSGAPPAAQYNLSVTGPSDGKQPAALRSAYVISNSATGLGYHFVFDGYGHLLKVTYPSGGYHRYDYIAYDFEKAMWQASCDWATVAVHHRYECTNAAGICDQSSESITTYTSPGADNSGVLNYVTVTSPDGSYVYHRLDDMYNTVSDPEQVFYDASGTKYRSVVSVGDLLPCATSLSNVITDTVYSGSSSLTKTTTRKFNYLKFNTTLGICYSPQLSTMDETGYLSSDKRSTVLVPYNNLTKNLIDIPGDTLVSDSVNGYGKLVSNSYDSDGKLISTTQSGDNAVSGTVSFSNYDDYGRPTQVTDARGSVTQYSYGTSWEDSNCPVSSNSMLTSVTNAKNQTTQYSYYSCSGLLASMTDPNGEKTSFKYDGAGRLLSASYASGGKTSHSYGTSVPVVNSQTLSSAPSPDVVSSVTYDGLMRVSEKSYADSSTMPIYTNVAYDKSGRVQYKTNQHYSNGSQPYGATSYAYDSQGRNRYICNSDNGTSFASCAAGLSYKENSYDVDSGLSLNAVTSYDESRNKRVSEMDADGNLREVKEYLQYGTASTSYQYDAFRNLISVAQNGVSGDILRNRSFIYDGLSRLISSTNSESGTTTYAYDANGNVHTKTDARGVVITYTYDALNRLTNKVYSDSVTPISCYQYDSSSVTNGIGRLANAWTQPAGTTCGSSPASGSYLSLKSITAYDAMGRPTNATQQQCIGTKCTAATPYSLSMAYDLAGNMTSLTNSVGAKGSSLSLGTSYDAAARPCLATSNWSFPNSSGTATTPLTLFQTDSSDGYAAFGGLQHWYMGSTASDASSACGGSVSTPITIQQTYTNRLWPKSITATGQMP